MHYFQPLMHEFHTLCEDGKNQEILVSEEFAETTDHPLYIVVNGVHDRFDYNEVSEESKKKSVLTNYGVKIYEQKITEEYEGALSDSEYNVAWTIDTWENGGYDGLGSSLQWEHIADIKKRDIGDDLYNVFEFYEFSNPVYFYSWSENSSKLFWGVTYEHDWYASLKTAEIWSAYFWDYLDIEFRASGADEFYQKILLDIRGSQAWSSLDENISGKGYVKIKSY